MSNAGHHVGMVPCPVLSHLRFVEPLVVELWSNFGMWLVVDVGWFLGISAGGRVQSVSITKSLS